MRRTYIGNRVVLEWYGDEILAKISKVSEEEERQTADRVWREVIRNTPAGSYRRSYRRTYVNMRGHRVSMKPWQQRLPGRLKSSIAKYKSKYKGGGWTVFAGNYLAYYARIVEYGTTARRQKSTGRFTGRQKAKKYMKHVLNKERRNFLASYKKRIRDLVRSGQAVL